MTTDLPHLRSLLAAATPGPWDVAYLNDDGEDEDPSWVQIVAPRHAGAWTAVTAPDGISGVDGKRDAALIVALRNAAPALLDELEALRAIAARARCRVCGAEAGFAACDCEHPVEAENRALRVENERLRRLAGVDTQWPLADVLESLATAVEHLFHHHNCDVHGWEEWKGNISRAREYAAITAERAARAKVPE